MLNGRRNGRGKMQFANGDTYEGLWKQDQMNDKNGVFTFADGNSYKGGLTACSKLISEGKFGCFEGQGELRIKGVGTVNGEFSQHQFIGNG